MRARRGKGRTCRAPGCAGFALAPPPAKRPQVRVFERKDANRRTDVLKGIIGLALGAVGFALAVIILLSLPGFLTDRDSVVPLTPLREAGQ